MDIFLGKFKNIEKKPFEEVTKKELLELWGFRGIPDSVIALYYQTSTEQVIIKREKLGINKETVQLMKYKQSFENITEQEIRDSLNGKAPEQLIEYIIDYKRYYDRKLLKAKILI